MTQVDVSSFALETNLANLKTEVDKIDIAKLTPFPDDLAKLSNVLNNDVVKKTEYDKLHTKVDNIDTTGFVSKTKYDTDKSDLEKKISDAEKRFLQLKIKKSKSKIINRDKYITTPEFNNLAARVFTARVAQANLVTKTDFDTRLQDISKRITSNKSKHLLVENELKKTAKI